MVQEIVIAADIFCFCCDKSSTQAAHNYHCIIPFLSSYTLLSLCSPLSLPRALSLSLCWLCVFLFPFPLSRSWLPHSHVLPGTTTAGRVYTDRIVAQLILCSATIFPSFLALWSRRHRGYSLYLQKQCSPRAAQLTLLLHLLSAINLIFRDS